MLNRGVIEKAVREVWPLTLVLGGALILVEGLLAYVLPTFRDEIAGVWGEMEFVQNLVKALLGAELGDMVGPQIFQALPWVHPIVLAIIWAFELTYCTRLPAAEIERGTIDILLGMPVSRWQAYWSETLVFLLSGAVLLSMGLVGNLAGVNLSPDDTAQTPGRLVVVLANGYCLYLAVGGVTYFFSSLSDRRGSAVGWGIAVVLSSFLLSFLEQFWDPAKSVAFLSLLTYYRPLTVFQDGGWPLADMGTLVVVGGLFWTLAGVIFQRRDICTV